MKKNILLLVPLLYRVLSLWWGTLRYRIVGDWRYTKVRAADQRVIFVLWHDEMFSLMPLHAGEKMAAVVSQSRDGEILSRLLRRSGYELARGSQSRGALDALRQALRQMKKGNDIVFTADGPRGPRHKVKPGPVYLAARTGALLIPVRVVMPASWKINRAWDKFQIPFPGSCCEVRYGRPYSIPPESLDKKEMARETERLEDIMSDLALRP